MYTIISATNRKGSNTLKVAKEYQKFFHELGQNTTLFSLEDFCSWTRDDAFSKIESDILAPTSKFIFIMPEYNGSFPGIFKLMMDLSDLATCWNHKKVMLVGVANGRAGNLRGLDTMTNMCNYMKMHVFYNKLPISQVSGELKDDVFVNNHTIDAIKNQIAQFLSF